MIKIRPRSESNWLLQSPEELLAFIKDASHPTGNWELVIVEMTKREIENFEVFCGW